MEKPLKFIGPNAHLEWALKVGYKFACGDEDVSSGEAIDALCDALCNLIGDEKFSEFVADDIGAADED